MKKTFSLILSLILALSQMSFQAFAKHEEDGYIFYEDFEDYKLSDDLPDGFSWGSIGADCTVSAKAQKFSDSHSTALRLTSEGAKTSYFSGKIEKTDISKGILKLSFSLMFENIPDASSYQQTVCVYGGTTSAPYTKGLRIDDGIVKYFSDPASRWKTSTTTAFMVPNVWYDFDIVSDFDSDKVTYYMNGKAIIDEKTGKIAETTGYKNTTTSISQIQLLVRTTHPQAAFGGAAYFDNISLSNSVKSGAFAADGNVLYENPSYLNLNFFSGVDLEKFDKDEITVKKYKSDDPAMTNGENLDFSIENLSPSNLTVNFGSEVTLDGFDKIEVDFGNNTNFENRCLAPVWFIKEKEDEEPITAAELYNSEKDGSYDVNLNLTNVEKTDIEYTDGASKESAFLFDKKASAPTTGYLKFERADGENVFQTGKIYELSFKIKIPESAYSVSNSDKTINIRGGFDALTDGETVVYPSGAARLLYFSNRYTTAGYFNEDIKKVSTVGGYNYSYNKNASIDGDFDALFDAAKWLDVKMTYYPDTKLYDVVFTNDSGKEYSCLSQNVFLSNSALTKAYALAYPDVDRNTIDGGLKSIDFGIQAKGGMKIVMDEILLTERENIPEEAFVKCVSFKNSEGENIRKDGNAYEPQIRKIDILFDGEIDADTILNTSVSGDNLPLYSVNYSAAKKTLSVDFEKPLSENKTYTVILPDTMNFKYGISQIPFETANGKFEISNLVSKVYDGKMRASVKVKNTASYANEPATLIVSSYKNGDAVNITASAILVGEGFDDTLYTAEADIGDCDTVKAFVLNNADLTHLLPYSEVKLADIGNAEKHEFEFSDGADGKFVTALVLSPDPSDRRNSYSLEALADSGAIYKIDAVSVKDGKYSFGFDINGASGKYTVYIADENGNIVEKSEIIHSDKTECENAQSLINSAVLSGDKDGVLNILKTYPCELGIEKIAIFKNAEISAEYVSELLFESVKNKALDISNMTDTQKRVGDICLAYALKNGKCSDIAEYGEIAEVFENEKFAKLYAKNVADTEKVAKRLSGKDITVSNLSAKLSEAAALEIIAEGQGFGNVKEIMTDFADEIGIDILRGTVDVYRRLDGNQFEDFDALGAEFNRIAPEKSTDGGGKGAPSKSTGSSSVTKGGFTGVTPNLPTPVEKEIFGDLNGFDWAKESINALYEKKIVSGKADGVFAPGDSIMREEFVKIIVGAFGIDGVSDKNFTDVSNGAWFENYIKKAFGAGIISGEGETFGVGKPITREDMAKIIYGVIKYKNLSLNTGNTAEISDISSVSDYASEAVKALYSANILKGNENGGFMPKSFATRAETAVIINRVLNYVK